MRIHSTRKGKQKNNDHLFFFFHTCYTLARIEEALPTTVHCLLSLLSMWWTEGDVATHVALKRQYYTHTHTEKKKKKEERQLFAESFFFLAWVSRFFFVWLFLCRVLLAAACFLLSLSFHPFFPCILCFLLHECRAFCALCCCSLARGVLGSRTAAVLEVHSSTCGDGYACHRSFFEDALLMECFCGSEAKREGKKRG